MGCLPIIAIFLLGTGIGYAVDGPRGAVWGAGIGLVAGLLSGLAVARLMRGARHD